ncbi:type VII secretion system-associated protein [Streptomyces sp. 21So2-11]|uniref:type VII secretion system-associated protein n=1 Tax=Streptomyces sp. 21So2-11 TaxID=3144408 RepID=UPI00321B5478
MTEPSGAAPAMVDESEMPEPPKEFVDAAKLAPDHWLYSIDPAWQGEGPPPDWAVVGQWRSDLDGVIVEWEDNENYQPSPEALGWPEPADDVDAAIQLATTGYGPAEGVTSDLVKAEVAVLVTASGEPVSASAPDGTPIVPVFTSPRYLHLAGRLGYEQVYVPALLGRIPEGHSLCINSSAPVSMIMTAEGLAEIAAAAAKAAEEETAGGETSGRDTPKVEWPTTVNAGEHATLRDALAAEVDGESDGESDGKSDGDPDREPDDEPDREAGVVDLPLPEPDARDAR